MDRPPVKKSRPKVLVYLFGSLGDTIVAIPALRAVRRHFPDSELVMLQNVQLGNIVRASEVVPGDLIDRYLDYSSEVSGSGRLQTFMRLRKELRSEKFGAVVYLVISERAALSVLRDKIFFLTCGIQRFFGFHAFSRKELFPVDATGHPAASEHEAVRKLDRLSLDGIKIIREEDLRQPCMTFSADEREPVENWLAERRIKPNSRLVALAPGCKTIANVWPVDRFIEVGRTLIADEDCEIVITGGKAEIELGERVARELNSGINAAGVFSVRESGILLSLCDLYIGLDTGTTHLAAAVGTPCFAIYGERNNPGHWYPLGDKHHVVSHRVECAGCREFECPIPDHPCMNEISAETVLRELRGFISNINETKAPAADATARYAN